jgi:hypothetical protein
MSLLSRFLQYGVDSALAQRAETASLTIMKVRTMSKKDIVGKFGLTVEEANELKKCT